MTNSAVQARRIEPWIPVGHPDFKWTSGADVQATWRRYGWTPPSEKRTQFFDSKPVPAFVKRYSGEIK